MINKDKIHKEIINGRLLKSYGSWMYCNRCNNTVGYLCYTTYQYFYFSFTCNCGNEGSFELGNKIKREEKTENDLLIKRNRLCCAIDEAPLFSIVKKNLINYNYEITCKKCLSTYIKK